MRRALGVLLVAAAGACAGCSALGGLASSLSAALAQGGASVGTAPATGSAAASGSTPIASGSAAAPSPAPSASPSGGPVDQTAAVAAAIAVVGGGGTLAGDVQTMTYGQAAVLYAGGELPPADVAGEAVYVVPVQEANTSYIDNVIVRQSDGKPLLF